MKVLAGVVLMVLVIGTSKATVHPMVGSWAGMRVDGGRIEVLVADVHSSGVAVGLVCFERPLDNLMIEFGRSDHLRDGRVEGDDIVVHGDVDGSVLRFVFTSGDTARFIETFPARDKRPFETGLTRVSQHECARGVRPRALGPREDAAPLLPPLGTWFAVWPDGLVAELTITGHDDPETLTGFYCNIRTSTWSLWRLGSASRRDVEAFWHRGRTVRVRNRAHFFCVYPRRGRPAVDASAWRTKAFDCFRTNGQSVVCESGCTLTVRVPGGVLGVRAE